MNLSEFLPNEYIPAIITAAVALITAVGAQFLNNWLTHRRENKKYFKEVYEKFISEFLIDILTLARINVLTRDTLKRDVDISMVLDNMFKKIHYADTHLQSLNLHYKTSKYMQDNYQHSKEILQLKICYFFLLYSKKIFKKIGLKLEPSVNYQLIHSIKVYAFLYIYSETRGYEESLKTITNIERLNLQVLKKTSLKDFHKLINNYDIEAIESYLKLADKELDDFLFELL